MTDTRHYTRPPHVNGDVRTEGICRATVTDPFHTREDCCLCGGVASVQWQHYLNKDGKLYLGWDCSDCGQGRMAGLVRQVDMAAHARVAHQLRAQLRA